MRTIIAGSRSITDELIVWRAIHDCGFHITAILSGCAEGVDQCGEKFATARMIPLYRFPADWEKHGKKAGPIRNEAMARNADAAIIVWDGSSKGTADMIARAKKHKLKLFVHRHTP